MNEKNDSQPKTKINNKNLMTLKHYEDEASTNTNTSMSFLLPLQCKLSPNEGIRPAK